jgi:hypothetical protein
MAPDADGRVEFRVDDWNLYDVVTLVLTNPAFSMQASLEYAYSAIEEGEPAVDLPWSAALEPLTFAPNPARQGTFVRFEVTDASRPTWVTVFDAGGRRVAQVVGESLPPGIHNRVWDGRDDAGRRAGSGVYRMVFEDCGTRMVEKIAVVR